MFGGALTKECGVSAEVLSFLRFAVAGGTMLPGKWLCRRLPNGSVRKVRIVETEAYCGESDTPCHAHCGKTERNAPMYEEGGIAYAYLC